MQPEVRWATPSDLDLFYDAHPGFVREHTVTALVGEVDGEIIAVGGFAHVKGYLVAFCDMDEKARAYKVSLVKAAKRLMASLPGNRVVLAQADKQEPGAARWIESLGFRLRDGVYRLVK